MFQTKVVEKIKTHILCSLTFCRKLCRLWDNVEKYSTARQATDDNITRRMRFACWITKVTDIHSKYVILIAFPRQQWLRERALMLRLYVHCLLLNMGFFCFKHMSSSMARIFWCFRKVAKNDECFVIPVCLYLHMVNLALDLENSCQMLCCLFGCFLHLSRKIKSGENPTKIRHLTGRPTHKHYLSP
jgi:hypothetical protein